MTHIDAHQHFWDPARGDYGWMQPDDPILARPYAPADLAGSLTATGVTHTVLVQAAPSVAETEYLLAIADATPHVAKVVGWVDFEDPDQLDTLRRLAKHPKFAGVRPMIQDLPDDAWMLRDDVQWAFRAIIEHDLTFDCLGFPRHLLNFHTLLSRYPSLRAVIDHAMKPHLRGHSSKADDAWKRGMDRLARDTSAYCKISGLVTEAETDWSTETLRPYTDHVLAAFGTDRVMWGSDWPVVRKCCEYTDWHAEAQALTAHLDAAAKARVFGGTARDFYRIPE